MRFFLNKNVFRGNCTLQWLLLFSCEAAIRHCLVFVTSAKMPRFSPRWFDFSFFLQQYTETNVLIFTSNSSRYLLESCKDDNKAEEQDLLREPSELTGFIFNINSLKSVFIKLKWVKCISNYKKMKILRLINIICDNSDFTVSSITVATVCFVFTLSLWNKRDLSAKERSFWLMNKFWRNNLGVFFGWNSVKVQTESTFI